MAESSSVPPTADKPVIVRVKRKVSQSALDAFCECSLFSILMFPLFSVSLILFHSIRAGNP